MDRSLRTLCLTSDVRSGDAVINVPLANYARHWVTADQPREMKIEDLYSASKPNANRPRAMRVSLRVQMREGKTMRLVSVWDKRLDVIGARLASKNREHLAPMHNMFRQTPAFAYVAVGNGLHKECILTVPRGFFLGFNSPSFWLAMGFEDTPEKLKMDGLTYYGFSNHVASADGPLVLRSLRLFGRQTLLERLSATKHRPDTDDLEMKSIYLNNGDPVESTTQLGDGFKDAGEMVGVLNRVISQLEGELDLASEHIRASWLPALPNLVAMKADPIPSGDGLQFDLRLRVEFAHYPSVRLNGQSTYDLDVSSRRGVNTNVTLGAAQVLELAEIGPFAVRLLGFGRENGYVSGQGAMSLAYVKTREGGIIRRWTEAPGEGSNLRLAILDSDSQPYTFQQDCKVHCTISLRAAPLVV